MRLSALSLSKRTSAIGLDIGNTCIRLVELSSDKKNNLRLERYAAEKLPADAIVDGNIVQLGQVINTMRRLWESCGSHAHCAALAIPSEAVMISTISLPGSSGAEIEKLVVAEVERRLGNGIEESCMDYSVIDAGNSAESDIAVLVATTPQEKLEDRLAIAESVGLTAQLADISSYAAYAALLRNPDYQASTTASHGLALLQIDEQTLQVCLLLQEQLVYERSYRIDTPVEADKTDQINNNTAQLSGLFYPFSLHQSMDLATPPESASAIESSQNHIASTAISALQTMQTWIAERYTSSRSGLSTPLVHIGKIIIAGPGATPDLAATLKQQLQIATDMANPFAAMTFAPTIDPTQLAKDAVSYVLACGLAVRLLT